MPEGKRIGIKKAGLIVLTAFCVGLALPYMLAYVHQNYIRDRQKERKMKLWEEKIKEYKMTTEDSSRMAKVKKHESEK